VLAVHSTKNARQTKQTSSVTVHSFVTGCNQSCSHPMRN